jgi:hypothetical protein
MGPIRCQRAIGAITWICYAVAILTAAKSSAVDLSFSQLSLNLDDAHYANTEYAALDVTYDGADHVQYLNVAVNGQWQVQNFPLINRGNVGDSQSIRFDVGMGTARGTVISSLDYAHSVTDVPTLAMPSGGTTTAIAQRTESGWTGAIGVPMPNPLPPAPPPGPPPPDPDPVMEGPYGHGFEFPNQESKKHGCGPTAVSNSLKWLKIKHNFDASDDDLSVASMEFALTWDDNRGVAINSASGRDSLWYEDKDEYITGGDEPTGWPVKTVKLVDWDEILRAVRKGKDVELVANGHIAAIVGISKTALGNYKLLIAHDTNQGQSGGTVIQAITYDSFNSILTGDAKWFNGASFDYAVAESVPEPSSLVISLTAILIISGFRGVTRRP